MGAPLVFNAPLGEILLDESEQGGDGLHRSWIMLLPLGEYEHPKGTLKLTRVMLAEVKRNFDNRVRGVEIALDYDHKASDGDSRAFGWLEAVGIYDAGRAPLRNQPAESYPGGLWGLVRWTKIGLDAVQDEIYRYISAEYRPEWTNPVNNTTYHNVLIGATLTNRPFMNHMPAVQLSEVSHTAWAEIDKSKLPNSAFLDPQRRRLPVYEGAGEIVNGRYSQRGALNLNGVRAALAAIHGAHTGKAMAGLPDGAAEKLQGWLDDYGGESAGASKGKAKAKSGSKSSREMSMVRATHLNKLLSGEVESAADDEDLELDEDEEEYDEEPDESDVEMDDLEAGIEDGDEPDDDGDENGADLDALARELQGRTLTRQSDRRSAVAAGRGSTSMGERQNEDASVLLAEATQLREKLAASEASRSAVEATNRDMAIKLYEQDLDRKIAAWQAPGDGEAGSVVPSTALTDKYRAFMLSEGLALSESQRKEIDTLLQAALTGAVELGQRSLSTADMDSRMTRSAGQTGDEHRVIELMEQIASRDYGETYMALVDKGSHGDDRAKAATRAIMSEAMKGAGYDVKRLSADLAARAQENVRR
jgi:hypothetical protein